MRLPRRRQRIQDIRRMRGQRQVRFQTSIQGDPRWTTAVQHAGKSRLSDPQQAPQTGFGPAGDGLKRGHQNLHLLAGNGGIRFGHCVVPSLMVRQRRAIPTAKAPPLLPV